jgi:hypothetical protein
MLVPVYVPNKILDGFFGDGVNSPKPRLSFARDEKQQAASQERYGI